MRTPKKDKIGLLLALFIIGIIYLKAVVVDVERVDSSKFIIYSNIAQNANFYIKTTYKKSKLVCNEKSIKIDIDKKHDYFYRGEEQITIALKRGENICRGDYIGQDIEQKISFIDFIVLFISLIVPISLLIFKLFIYILNRANLNIKEHKIMEKSSTRWIFSVILLGIAIRILYFNKYGIMLFQHDWQGHIDLIKYIASNYSIPNMPNKGWEYPQQPLYYIITAFIYNILISFDFSSKDALHYGVGYFSLLCSFIFLYYSYRVVELLTKSRWVLMVSMLFLTLTPSLVYMSSRVNNDVLVLALSSIALFFSIKAYYNNFEKYLYLALISVSLLFLTKISTASIELLLFILLIISYIKTKKELPLFIFSFVGIFLLSWTLWHLYTPLNGGFYMVNSAKFPKQTIEQLNSSYFLSFHLIDLLKQGYSYVFGVDSVRYSFPTYQYGTMFFGEFDYKFFTDKTDFLLVVMKSILILGVVYIIGSISYLIHFYKESLVNRVIFGVLVINLILILKFVISYPSICNTDFRYFVSSFIIFGYIFAQGLEYLFIYHRKIKYIVSSILALLFINELIFFYGLIF